MKSADLARPEGATTPEMEIAVVVRGQRRIADDVLEFEFAARGGESLPSWTPGAHLDLVLPSGQVRQYSLCGDLDDPDRYRVAILRCEDGRGGSKEAHDTLTVGHEVVIRGPRNHFPLEEAPAYVFIAGGIGITPLLPMMKQLAGRGADWRLHYGGRSTSSMAYVQEIEANSALRGRARYYPQDEKGLLPVAAVVASAPEGALLYCCGPEGLIDAVQDAAGRRGSRVRVERFSPRLVADPATQRRAFEVEFAASGVVATVGADESIVDVARAADLLVFTSCEEGMCGTCETRVLAGEPEHHDSVLTDEQRASGDTMMICVGRAKGPRLVLDL